MNVNEHKYEIAYHEIEKSLLKLPKYQVPIEVIQEIKNNIDNCIYTMLEELKEIIIK